MSFLYFDEAEVTVTTFYKFSASDGGVLLIGSLDNTVVDRLNAAFDDQRAHRLSLFVRPVLPGRDNPAP